MDPKDFASLLNVWQVLAFGLLFGAGLPALFALGVRSLAVTAPAPAGDGAARTTLLGRVGAVAAFGLCAAAAIFGVVVIVFGKQIFGA